MTTPLKVLTASLLTAALASVALAGPPPGKGKPERGCKPSVAVVLKGDLVSFTETSFVIDVKRSNKHGKALAGQQTVAYDAGTKFRPKRYDDFKDAVAGFRLNVQSKVCKRDPEAAVVARRVTLHPAKTEEDSGTTP